MKLWKGFLVTLGVVALASVAYAQGETAIGLFWDAEATQTLMVGNEMVTTGYICVVDAEQVVGGAAFMLEKDTRLTLTNAVFPAGITIGDLLTGIQIGFTNPVPGFFGDPVLLATVSFFSFSPIIDNAELSIVAYPAAGEIQLADRDGLLRAVSGLTSYLTIPVDEDQTSWGGVKALYND